jgi:hypothetical protein
MKNQYIGDVGDYGKYGLLRFLADKGVKIGVNWYLTEGEDNFGKDRDYLKREDKFRPYDPKLFESMKALQSERNVARIKELGIIPNAIYFDEPLNTDDLPAKERKAARVRWHRKAFAELIGAELVFADPDVGTLRDPKLVSRKGAEHYADLHELAEYYGHGQDVVYYCHRARRNSESWRKKKTELSALCPKPAIFVLTYSRGMQRSYIFAVHPGREEKFRALIDEFLATPWGSGDKAPFREEDVI